MHGHGGLQEFPQPYSVEVHNPFSVDRRLGEIEIMPTRMTLQLANRSHSWPPIHVYCKLHGRHGKEDAADGHRRLEDQL